MGRQGLPAGGVEAEEDEEKAAAAAAKERATAQAEAAAAKERATAQAAVAAAAAAKERATAQAATAHPSVPVATSTGPLGEVLQRGGGSGGGGKAQRGPTPTDGKTPGAPTATAAAAAGHVKPVTATAVEHAAAGPTAGPAVTATTPDELPAPLRSFAAAAAAAPIGDYRGLPWGVVMGMIWLCAQGDGDKLNADMAAWHDGTLELEGAMQSTAPAPTAAAVSTGGPVAAPPACPPASARLHTSPAALVKTRALLKVPAPAPQHMRGHFRLPLKHLTSHAQFTEGMAMREFFCGRTGGPYLQLVSLFGSRNYPTESNAHSRLEELAAREKSYTARDQAEWDALEGFINDARAGASIVDFLAAQFDKNGLGSPVRPVRPVTAASGTSLPTSTAAAVG